MKINENRLALEISRREGKKKALPIGQIKEVLRIALHLLAKVYKPSEVMALVEKHR